MQQTMTALVGPDLSNPISGVALNGVAVSCDKATRVDLFRVAVLPREVRIEKGVVVTIGNRPAVLTPAPHGLADRVRSAVASQSHQAIGPVFLEQLADTIAEDGATSSAGHSIEPDDPLDPEEQAFLAVTDRLVDELERDNGGREARRGALDRLSASAPDVATHRAVELHRVLAQILTGS